MGIKMSEVKTFSVATDEIAAEFLELLIMCKSFEKITDVKVILDEEDETFEVTCKNKKRTVSVSFFTDGRKVFTAETTEDAVAVDSDGGEVQNLEELLPLIEWLVE